MKAGRQVVGDRRVHASWGVYVVGCLALGVSTLGSGVCGVRLDLAVARSASLPQEPAPEIRQKAQKDEARALLARWLDTQNSGDFESYMALYAPRFAGIRRSGERRVVLDRKRWQRERARMFTKPMTVSATNVKVYLGQEAMSLSFEQTWASAAYADRGPKNMLLRQTPEGWRIAREEMIASHESRMHNLPAGSVLGQFAFVNGRDVILSESQSDCVGQAALMTEEVGGETVHCHAALPEALAVWKDQAVTLYGEGPPCTTKLTSFERSARLVMPSDDEEDDGTARPARALAERRATRIESLWSSGAPLLVGHPEGCKTGTFHWARVSSLPAPFVATLTAVADKDARTITRASRALPQWKEAQRTCGGRDADHPKGHWDEGAATQRVGIVADVSMKRERLSFVSYSTGVCSDSCAELSALFREGRDGRLSVVATGDNWTLLAVIDTDQDGRLELLFESSEGNDDVVLSRTVLDEGSVRLEGAKIAAHRFYGCGC